MPSNLPKGRVVRVERCELVAADLPWPFADQHSAGVNAHWQRRLAENPNFFNGRIRMLADYAVEGDTLRGRFLETGFKEFLYWRETGEPDAGVTDAFASAVIWSRDGAVLLGRQRPGNINTGLSYLPGGFVDSNDVASDGRIDIAASSMREVAEETGIGADLLVRRPGFLLTFTGRQLSIGVEFSCDLGSSELSQTVMATLAQDPASELAEVVMVHRQSDLDLHEMPAFARLLLQHLLP